MGLTQVTRYLFAALASSFIVLGFALHTKAGLSHTPMLLFLLIVNAIGGYWIGILYERVHRLSMTDELTGAFNRRFLMREAEKQLSLAKRHGHPVSLVILDVDHFKDYNDAHGHAKGDKLLADLSRYLKANIRETDIFTRFGGDEFLILLPHTAAPQAFEFVDRIRRSQSFGATFSAGIASFPEHGTSFTTLLQLADRALYRAKAQRNEVRIAS